VDEELKNKVGQELVLTTQNAKNAQEKQEFAIQN